MEVEEPVRRDEPEETGALISTIWEWRTLAGGTGRTAGSDLTGQCAGSTLVSGTCARAETETGVENVE